MFSIILSCRYVLVKNSRILGSGEHKEEYIRRKRGNNVRKKTQRIFIPCFLFLFMFCLNSGKLHSSIRKLVIVADEASIHLDPDQKSTVVATLKRGTLVSLGSERKFRTNWNYVYFTSEKTGNTKSGYILDSLVKKLYEVTKKSMIQREGDEEEAEVNTETNFRSARWGMSKQQILRMEGHPAQQDSSGGLDVIQYLQTILNMDCMIGFVFAENKLVKAKYSFLTKHGDKNQYIQDYSKIRDILVEKYGNPETESALWQDDRYKNESSNWGQALSLGHLRFDSTWQDSETEIHLGLNGGRDKIFLVVEYAGLDYRDLTQQVADKSQSRIW
jgi:hypothetical protein